MRMDENENPEWRRMLGSSAHGRKALDVISGLESKLDQVSQELFKVRHRYERATTPLPEGMIVRVEAGASGTIDIFINNEHVGTFSHGSDGWQPGVWIA